MFGWSRFEFSANGITSETNKKSFIPFTHSVEFLYVIKFIENRVSMHTNIVAESFSRENVLSDWLIKYLGKSQKLLNFGHRVFV